MSISVKKVNDTIVSKSVLPSKAMTMAAANARIAELEAELAKATSVGIDDDAAIAKRLSAITWDMTPRTNTPQQSERERQEKQVVSNYFREQTRLIDREETRAKSAYAHFPEELGKALKSVADARAKLERERAEINKPVGFSQQNTPVSGGVKNFYYLASKEYYIAMLTDGSVVVKKSGDYTYKRLVQNTLSTPTEPLGTYSYPELTAEMFKAIIEGKPTYQQLYDVYKIQPVKKRIVLEGSQATVIW